MKPKLDKRKAQRVNDLIQAGRKPLTAAQKSALLLDLLAGHQTAVKGGDERSFDTWRAAVITAETADHRAGPLTGLRQATQSHFRALRARAYEEQGRLREAYDLRISDSPGGARVDLLLHLVLEQCAKRIGVTLDKADHRPRDYADKCAQNRWRCSLASCDATQLEVIYLSLKSPR